MVDSAILRHCWEASTAAWEEELPCPRARVGELDLGELVGRTSRGNRGCHHHHEVSKHSRRSSALQATVTGRAGVAGRGYGRHVTRDCGRYEERDQTRDPLRTRARDTRVP